MLPVKYWNKTNLVLFLIILIVFIVSIIFIYNCSMTVEQII